MGTIVYPLPTLTGNLSGFVGNDIDIGAPPVDGAVAALTLSTPVAPSGGPITMEVRTAAAGVLLTATVPDGQLSARVTGAELITGGTTLLARLTAQPGGGLILSGYVEFEPSMATLSGDGLTDLASVKAHAGIGDGSKDALLTTLIATVSTKMRTFMDRHINQRVVVAEAVSGSGFPELMLREYPVTSVSEVRVNTVALASASYAARGDSGILLRTSGGVLGSWPEGVNNVEVDYTGGYATVPGDLFNAATEQVRHEYAQTQPSGANRLGERVQVLDAGGQSQFEQGGFLPSTVEAMMPYRRVAA